MSEIEFKKGPVDLDEIVAYIRDLSDPRNDDEFPKFMHNGVVYIIHDILNSWLQKRRMVTMDLLGRKKLFDIPSSDPLFFDGTTFYLQDDHCEMKWEEYYSYWRNLGTRPDVIDWGGESYIVYSITKITGDDSLYLTIGSKPTERIMIQLTKNTVITRDHTRLFGKPKWIIEFAKQISYQTKWD